MTYMSLHGPFHSLTQLIVRFSLLNGTSYYRVVLKVNCYLD